MIVLLKNKTFSSFTPPLLYFMERLFSEERRLKRNNRDNILKNRLKLIQEALKKEGHSPFDILSEHRDRWSGDLEEEVESNLHEKLKNIRGEGKDLTARDRDNINRSAPRKRLREKYKILTDYYKKLHPEEEFNINNLPLNPTNQAEKGTHSIYDKVVANEPKLQESITSHVNTPTIVQKTVEQKPIVQTPPLTTNPTTPASNTLKNVETTIEEGTNNRVTRNLRSGDKAILTKREIERRRRRMMRKSERLTGGGTSTASTIIEKKAGGLGKWGKVAIGTIGTGLGLAGLYGGYKAINKNKK